MPRTSFAAQTPKGPFPGVVSAGDLDLVMTAGDDVDGNEVPFISSRMFVVARNVHASAPYTVTFTSAPDPISKRSADISAFSMAAGDVIGFFVSRAGWEQVGGLLYLDCEDASIEFAVVVLP